MLRLGYPAEPGTLDPLAPGGGSSATRDILRPVLPALFGLNAKLRPEPELVAAWPSSKDIRSDPFSVTLRLRRASWSDGRPITSSDVRFSRDKLAHGPTGYRYRFLRDVEVIDDHRFTLHFDRPMRRWWSLFSLDDMVLPEHAYSEDWAHRPTVSGGPFAVREWTEGLRVHLVRNDSYWGQSSVLAGIDVLFVPDDETRLQLLERSELDAAFFEGDSNTGRRARAHGFPPRAPGALDGHKAASGAWGPTWWELDMGNVPANVAAAVAELADTNLVAEILEDSAAPMDGIPTSFPVRNGAIAGPWAGRGDLDEARLSLGGSRGDLELAFPRGTAGAIGSFLHFRLRKVGVTVELVGLEDDTFERALDQGSVAPAVIRLRRGADGPDAAAYASASKELGSASVDDYIAGAENAPPGSAAPIRLAGLSPTPWTRAQQGLQRAHTAIPLARVRTWIVGREGLAGPQPLGALTGPLWNAATWRFL